MNKKFLLVDGNFLMFQSFYASYMPNIQLMTDSQGRSTNGVHVFMMTLHKLIEYINPDYLFIAFDAHGKTKRHEQYEDYKAGRSKAPTIIFEQFAIIKDILSSWNIKWFEQEGDEADDLIATLCKNSTANNYIYSKDQDLLQLVDANTEVIFKSKEGFFDTYNIYNFENYHGILPSQIPDYKGLAGDSSDNIKGVNGIGSIGAKKLINTFGSIENIYANISQLKGAIKQKLIAGEKDAFFCKSLTTLNKEVIMNSELDFYSVKKIDKNQGLNKMMEYELNSTIIRWKRISF
ncbi:DNA-directed DNA polymerase [Mycoplasmopsis californica HAZ160_1]|uniref:5'-3' exonuclease n=1 Tax=Mycoplasmopsis californica HAZ160_1 TaxID=1397850 RepID=A0AAT9F7E3_9BACT|nr:5'-3' exonuclease [Mycoplasmopsis californica]BAP00797.1 DNA-directed DNA polymerase [Mycoplasmopsis californica HAZ160_1]BBG40650.1 DNA-directed DNA polymerase [Mycoplasmopsis californica]BBG41245.1 DNA-directed DNA polymerase [Mycoplasmopsis californica]BBG41838.1 DNA-directed DNA polymerase [Mycoplasmopsis californica]BBG42433.1 DNA-directed DNA polymerase [Mycoplasmopsis californica]